MAGFKEKINLYQSQELDWQDPCSFVFFNTRSGLLSSVMQDEWLQTLKKVGLSGHLWFQTSGSTGEAKWVALSKGAFLSAARSVNKHLEVTASDVFLNVLPEFHVGGMAVRARADISGARLVSFSENWRWNVDDFVNQILQHKVSISSLVPTQVFDLVEKKKQAPSSLRAVIVGGGHLSKTLYDKARDLGWPLLSSYGMTETSAAVAVASLQSLQNKEDSEFLILDHVEIKKGPKNNLCFRGKSLLTGYFLAGLFIDPKDEQGWFQSEDLGEVKEVSVEVYGRGRDFVKINGENVSLQALRNKWQSLSVSLQHYLMTVEDLRRGHRVLLVTENEKEATVLFEKFQDLVRPFERIDQIYVMNQIPRTALGKVDELEIIREF